MFARQAAISTAGPSFFDDGPVEQKKKGISRPPGRQMV
jgi:hypothetical protein